MKKTDNTNLACCLKNLGPDRVWRSVQDNDGNLIFQGQGFLMDGMAQPSRINFTNKTVADLGCNLGYFSFQAHGEGAKMVHGYDEDAQVIQAANLLKKVRATPGIDFFCKNILSPPPQVYDIAMLIDIIGKQILVTGKLDSLLDGLARYASSMIILTARRFYRIKNDLKTTPEELASQYGTADIQANKFNLMDHIIRHYSAQWKFLELHEDDKKKPEHTKVMLRFVPCGKQR